MKARFLIPLAIFLVLVGLFYKGLSLDPREVPSPFIGKTAPAFDLPTLEAGVSERADQAGPHQALGLAYAVLGRRDDAVREGLRATELLPVVRNAYDGPPVLLDLARIYAMVGDLDLAIDQLQVLLSIPGDLSVPLLAIDPTWDPLRGSPRFQELLEG